MILFGWGKKELSQVEALLYEEKRKNRALEKQVHDLSMQVEKQKNEILMNEQTIRRKERIVNKLRKEIAFKNTLKEMERELNETISECNGALNKRR